ncbi:MAG: hypothetical protein GY862_19560 [Gammaproteobacteria bacterium]|nr:hypothetical protein [Gammaproteobacteria bacterium]
MNNRDDLLKSYETGNFLETVYACLLAKPNDHSALASELAALHNEGLIDVVEAFKSLKNNPSNGGSFFYIEDVFKEALPDLDASTPSVMQCVLQLHREAGQDLAARSIINAFIDFCAKDPSRPCEALTEIKANPKQYLELLPETLVAGSHVDNPLYLAEAIRLCEHTDIEWRRQAVFSIGRLSWPENIALPDAAFAALEHSAEIGADDKILANIIKSAFALLQQDKSQEARIITLIGSVLSKGSHLLRIKPANKETLNNVDYAISYLFEKGDPEKAIQLLENLLLAHPNELTLEVFDSAARKILGNNALLSKVLTRWFLRGERVLCDGVYIIFSKHHGDNLSLGIDPSELKTADFVHIVFVARKAIGYLFNHPISAASILISLMRHTADDDVLTELGALLFNPLLLNYTGEVREYVAQQSNAETGKVKETIDKALSTVEDYLNDLRSVGELAALHPSEAQREAHHRHFSRLMAESYKAAEAKSVLLNLCSKSVLLYGRKSISYIYGDGGKPHRTELPLQSHSTKIELPRMENLDPFGLDYVLRIFRAEKFSV